MIQKVLSYGVVMFLAFSVSLSQNVSFTASVQSNQIAMGAQFQLSFTVTSSESVNPERFQPPDLSQLVVLSGPMQSSQYQWINGKASSSLSYVYTLTGKKLGKVPVGPASVEVAGKSYKTDELQLEIVAAAPGAVAQNPLADIGDNLFIKAIPDKKRVRQGEQFILTYRLYTRLSIENYFVSKAPTFEGLWAEDFEQSKSPEVVTETLNGKQYRVATIKRTALFATQSGTLKITPLQIRCSVQLQTRRSNSDPFDIFNDPIFSNRLRTQEVDISSNALSMTVSPLAGTPPQGFTGAVGSFSFDASVDRMEVKTGDPVTLRLTVSGAGNLKLVAVPKPAFPTDIESYDPKVAEEISRDGNQIHGKKTAEYLLIPRNPGTRVIDPVSFVYYDLARNAYVTLKSAKFALNVLPGKEMTGSTFASKEDVRLLGEDIRFLKLSPGTLVRGNDSQVINVWIVAGFFIPPLLFLGAFTYRKREEKLLGNSAEVRSRKAGREASRRFKTAEKLLGSGNPEQYHAEISRAMFGYLGDKLRISPATLTLDLALQTLKEKGLPEEPLNQLKACIERAEYTRFAPGSDSQEARKDLLDQAKEVIKIVEKHTTK